MIIEVKSAYLKAALINQAKNDIRFYLNGICFMPDGRLAATDGHALFKGYHESKLDAPVILAVKGKVPASFERAIITMPDPVAGESDAERLSKDGTIRYTGSMGATVGMGWCEFVDGRFPDIDKASVNTERGSRPVAYIPGTLMERACKVAKLFATGRWLTPMEMHMPKEDNHNYVLIFRDIESGGARVPQMNIMPYRP